MKGAGQFKVTKRGFDGRWITFAFVGKVLTREINVGLFAGGRKECHLANEDPDQYINGRISFVGSSWELDLTYAGERQVWLRIETRQYSHQGLRVLIFTDRPGPRAHLVEVYIELRDLIVFSSAVQVGSRNYLTTRPRVTVPPFEVIFIDFCT
ncbi:hypothetical protein AVEN_82783-1 [Araneus ventricosus]|uniref:Uncharacterized protein n=1 Tax=Araneus ventricosus TaxID=182803 RepID=A0A4Y2DA00_ARAVE|nr:hypothetical protein AVEN_82783-1 [Araneus ventricosus]